MAYSVKGVAIINDGRELLGVNTAGIVTALYVGENITLDAATGIVTTSELEVQGDLNINNNGNLIIGAGGSITAEGIFLEVDGEAVGVATIAPGGDVVFTNIDASGYVRVGAGLTLDGSLSFSAGDADEFVTGITTDLSESAGANELVTAAGVEAYVTASVGDAGTLDFVDENGVLGQINIGAGETLGLIGETNEIVTNVVGTGNTQLQISLSDELIIPGSVVVTGLSTFNDDVEFAATKSFVFSDGNKVDAIGVSSALAEDAAAETRLVSEKAIRQFVDGVSANVEANANLRIEDAAGGIGTVALGTENLVFNGVANETLVEVSGVPGELTVGLATDVTISGDLIVTNDFSFDGGQLVNVIGIETSLVDTTAGIATNTSIPTQQAVKEYVDSQIAETGGSLNFEGDSGTGSVDLSSQDLRIFGTPDEIVTAGAGQSITVGLTSSVEITSTLAAANVNGTTVNVGTSAIGGESNLNNLTLDIGGPGNTYAMFTNGSSLDGFRFVDNLTDVFVLDHSGATNVATLTGHLDVSAGADITGICTATDFNSTSDIRKKENIVEIADAVEKVEALRGVTFDWKDGSGKSGGTIAQEVQAVLPEIVKEGEHLTVNYNGLTGLLIQAVKELSARVAELEGKA